MKTLVINLDRSTDRLAHCQSQFERLHIGFERVQAVDGRTLSREVIDSIYLRKDWPKPTDSEFACFMSHRKCWELLANSDEKYAVIFEDDIILVENAINFLENIDWIPEDIDILRLETFKMEVYYKRWDKIPVKDRHLMQATTFHVGTGGYIISSKFASALLNMTSNYMPAPIDHFLFDPKCGILTTNSVYQLVPAICAQEKVLMPDNYILEQSIKDRSVVNVPAQKRDTPTQGQKIIRELKRSFKKLKRFVSQKRIIVDIL